MSSGCRSVAAVATGAGFQLNRHNRKNNPLKLWCCKKPNCNSFSSRVVPQTKSHTLAAAAAGSGAATPSSPYGEPLLGVEKKEKKKRTVAGIDQDDLCDPSELADPDSCFLDFKGLQIHHKIYDHSHSHDQHSTHPSPIPDQTTSKLGFPFILLHGFGASLFSWHRVMKPLAQVTASKVVAFDRPAFGLTSRSMPTTKNPHSTSTAAAGEDSKTPNPFSTAFSVLATLTFLHLLAADKAILIGHSAGSLVAVNTYFEAPERVAALILVAPAIFAPVAMKKNEKQRGSESEDSTSKVRHNPLIMIGRLLSKLSTYIAQTIVRIWKGMVDMVSSLYKKALAAILRSTIAVMLVRMVIDKFGIPAIRNAWYDANQITDHVLDGYKKPLRTKGWDRALLEYTAALLTDSETGPPLSERLSEISCPVLIVTGDSDRLTPSWNAERLSQAIPGSCLEIIKNCGHLPQEEKVDEFISIVQKFLQRAFSAPEEQILQAATS